ncbi:ParA family protein [Paeniroseomonas aquatica]|uniref:ParA family protein n=1 Tax=Paeniroseomonas aquatica TaxID=373043 RepID=UPI0033907601
MRIILVYSAKGGSGKTTTARELAVAATLAGRRVAMIDLDPQGSLTSWYGRREADAPALVTAAPGAWQPIADAGFDELVIDAPPGVPPWLEQVAMEADAVLVPVRPSPDDLVAAAATAGMLARHPAWAFLLTQAPSRSRLADGTVRQLAAIGRLAPTTLGFRTDYPTAAVSGTAACEYPGTKSFEEVTQLRTYVDMLGAKHVPT